MCVKRLLLLFNFHSSYCSVTCRIVSEISEKVSLFVTLALFWSLFGNTYIRDVGVDGVSLLGGLVLRTRGNTAVVVVSGWLWLLLSCCGTLLTRPISALLPTFLSFAFYHDPCGRFSRFVCVSENTRRAPEECYFVCSLVSLSRYRAFGLRCSGVEPYIHALHE